MKPIRVFVLLLVVGVVVLAGCGGAASPTEAPSPSPVQPAATPAPTNTAPAAAAPTATPEPPAATPTPSLVDTPTDTPMPTALPTETPTPEPTPTSTPAVFDPGAVDLSLELVIDGLDSPVFATGAGDGSNRIFVLEKAGVIVVSDENGQQPQTFLDIRDRVRSSASEQGLLGLAFHPQFAQNGRFFLYYTDNNGDTTISRFQANADLSQADPASEAVLLTQAQPAGNHNGGMLAFGADGMLYAGLGDGGGAGDRYRNGQNLDSILGTIIRIDVDHGDAYAVPAGNPFVDTPDARPEIWAYGLRNPWRFSFDRATGDLYIADVGQNEYEEVDFQAAGSAGGENYGWPIMEATHCYDSGSCDQGGLVLPVAEYSHSQGCSVTGGYVYRGDAQPSLNGAYFYGDYCSGRVWALSQDGGGQWQSTQLLDTDLQISSFGQTEAGEVLAVDIGGAVYRLVNQP
jgi:glucose/arabinose dehydrogenase